MRRIGLAALLCLGVASQARADACARLAGRVVTVTGAAIAGRSGSTVAFGAADADLMLLDCRAPGRMILRARFAEPSRATFVLVGLAAQALAGARAEEAERLALVLHRAAREGGGPASGRAGPVAITCTAVPVGEFPTSCLLRRAGRAGRDQAASGVERVWLRPPALAAYRASSASR
ncbi:hypothetical protein QA634_29730 [Methylobacterium sp. CB376]|uniref:hypothetical protein n=1 Tax=unclassified Methylobacterium TaxID=2615210 RepID=UPI0002F90D7E|nr:MULTISPECIES: hypothetical protein [Methylobacterium]WFT79354.1 hypothetical protein QA634_29730 [Methylobacterium nodulans]